ncbi:MAG: ABC transporter permease [Clostridiales bacterium]|nr:ABC transporter permease [Clostridiales bacterium]
MTVYKYFLKISWKNRFAIVLYVILFFVIVIINSTDLSPEDFELAFKENKLNVGVIDKENSDLSNGLVEYIRSKNNIIETKDDEIFIEDQIFMGIADGVIIIPPGFDESVVSQGPALTLYTDDRNPKSVQIGSQINKYLALANISYENGSYNLDKVANALQESAKVTFTDDNGEVESKVRDLVNLYFNLAGYAIIAIYIMVIGLVMSEINKEQIVNRRNVSSIKLVKYNLQILLGQLTLAGLTTLIFLVGFVVWKGTYIELINYDKYIVNIIVFSVSILSLTFLVTNITNNKYAIMAIATVLSLGISFISGVMVPQDLLGENVLSIAKFFPVYYFVKANNANTSSLLGVSGELLMMTLFSLVFLLMGIIMSKGLSGGRNS